MILPDAVDAQIFARIALAYESGVFQKPRRAGVGGDAGGLDAVQPQAAESERNDGANRRRHVAVARIGQAHPIAEAAGLGDASPDIGEPQAADPCAVGPADDEEGTPTS